jgi:hypothetical protein
MKIIWQRCSYRRATSYIVYSRSHTKKLSYREHKLTSYPMETLIKLWTSSLNYYTRTASFWIDTGINSLPVYFLEQNNKGSDIIVIRNAFSQLQKVIPPFLAYVSLHDISTSPEKWVASWFLKLAPRCDLINCGKEALGTDSGHELVKQTQCYRERLESKREQKKEGNSITNTECNITNVSSHYNGLQLYYIENNF